VVPLAKGTKSARILQLVPTYNGNIERIRAVKAGLVATRFFNVKGHSSKGLPGRGIPPVSLK
jgi:hypothetical protein